MSEALERVIAEQQKKIDHQSGLLEIQMKSLNTVFSRHSELFESFARLIDVDVPDDVSKEYRRLRQTCRFGMLEAGYCMTCYNFVCECEGTP
jgi:hypothetical protein